MKSLDATLADAGRVEDLTEEAFHIGRASIATVVSPPVSSRTATPGRASWVRRRKLAVAATAAAVAALVTVPALGIGWSDPSGRADAATVLRAAGRAAGDQPGGWPSAPYWHATSSYVRDGQTFQREIWVAHHGTTVVHDTGLDGPAAYADGGSFSAGSLVVTWDQLYALPTDPEQLAATLLGDDQGPGREDGSELFGAVGYLLRESPASPELREALYDVAADIPQVQVTGQVTDSEGRTGTEVELDDHAYVIDPSTGQLLAETEEGVTTTYLTQGPADTAPPVAPR